MGINRTKEYAELEWPLAVVVAIIWVLFSVNVFMTILKRKEEQMYISLWYIMAALVGVTVLYVVNNLGMPLHLFRMPDLQIAIADRIVPIAIARRPNPKNQMPSPNRIEFVRITSRSTLFCLTAS